MPISFYSMPRSDVPFIRVEGTISLVDLIGGITTYAGSPALNARRILVDAQPVEELDLTAREFLNFIPVMRNAVARRKVPVDVYVAVRKPMVASFLALYDRFAGPSPLIRLRPYATLGAALKAMDLPAGALTRDVVVQVG